MKGLLTKEFILIEKNITTFFIVITFALLGIFSDGTFFLVYAAIILGSIPVGNMTYDETSRWQQYSISMPYKRNWIVATKYIVTMLLTLLSAVLMAISTAVSMLRDGDFDIQTSILTLSIVVAIGLIFPALSFPLNFKFGTTKGNILRLIILGTFTAACTSIVFIGLDVGDEVFGEHILHKFSMLSSISIAAIILGVTAIIFTLSWIISIKVFENKDL